MTRYGDFSTIIMVENEYFNKFAAMKAKNILIFIIGSLFIPLYLASCGEDRWPEYAQQTRTDSWIDDTMRVWYYWNEDIPSSKTLNYFSAPSVFFKSLLSKQDKFSTIDSITTSSSRSLIKPEYGYGIQFALDQVKNNDTAYYARVLYAVHNSPASDANLDRGKWIMALNNQPITKKNYAQLFGGNGMSLTVGHYDADKDTIVAYNGSVALSASTSLNDNPVYYCNTYIKGNNRIGYLVYNRFSPGSYDNATQYDQALLEASKYFAGQNINQLILDLRYNNGGSLGSAQLLCTILAPSDKLGSQLGYLEFNKKITPREQSFMLDKSLITNGSNLNLNTLYILTSSETASASEMVINCLKPYMSEIVLIGQKTVGKNVGSKTFVNTELQIAISPIVCKVYNSKSSSDYSSGFTPDYPLSESSNLSTYLPFGNENETLLAKALSIITNTNSSVSGKQSFKVTPILNSISRKATRAVRID